MVNLQASSIENCGECKTAECLEEIDGVLHQDIGADLKTFSWL